MHAMLLLQPPPPSMCKHGQSEALVPLKLQSHCILCDLIVQMLMPDQDIAYQHPSMPFPFCRSWSWMRRQPMLTSRQMPSSRRLSGRNSRTAPSSPLPTGQLAGRMLWIYCSYAEVCDVPPWCELQPAGCQAPKLQDLMLHMLVEGRSSGPGVWAESTPFCAALHCKGPLCNGTNKRLRPLHTIESELQVQLGGTIAVGCKCAVYK